MIDKYQNVRVVIISGHSQLSSVKFTNDSYNIDLKTDNQNQIDLIAGLASNYVNVSEERVGEATKVYGGPYKSTTTSKDINDLYKLMNELKSLSRPHIPPGDI